VGKPKLYVFAISHYCEKACWALDYHRIDFELKHTAPGLHIALAKRLRTPRNFVPILSVNGTAIQGSANIVDWADQQAPAERRLSPAEHSEECRAIEQRLDDVAGVHVRRYFYSEAMLECPERVKPIFSGNLGFGQKLLFNAVWGKLPALMARGMDLGPVQGRESKAIIVDEMNWLDEKLADGRSFLVGDRFTRADLAAASLLAPLAMTSEHPTYTPELLPPGVAGDVAKWHERPCLRWVRSMYEGYRRR